MLMGIPHDMNCERESNRYSSQSLLSFMSVFQFTGVHTQSILNRARASARAVNNQLRRAMRGRARTVRQSDWIPVEAGTICTK